MSTCRSVRNKIYYVEIWRMLYYNTNVYGRILITNEVMQIYQAIGSVSAGFGSDL